MKTKQAIGIVLGLLVMGASRLALADNVVVQPAPAATPAPAPAPGAAVVVQPTQQAPVTPVAVATEPSKKAVVHADISPPHNYMATIASSALLGAVAGALVGGAIYFLGNQTHAANIGYWAAGGVLVGTGVGFTQIMVQESRASQATALQSDPARTYRLALYTAHF